MARRMESNLPVELTVQQLTGHLSIPESMARDRLHLYICSTILRSRYGAPYHTCQSSTSAAPVENERECPTVLSAPPSRRLRRAADPGRLPPVLLSHRGTNGRWWQKNK